MKHTVQFKIAAVQDFLGSSASFAKVAGHHGVSSPMLRAWVARYQQHGAAGLSERKRGHYTAEYKLSVLRHMWDNGLSYRQTAVVFNLPNSSRIGEWERRYQSDGAAGLRRRQQNEQQQDESANNKTDSPRACRGDPHARRALEGAGLASNGECLLKKVESLSRREVSSSEKTQVVHELRHQFPLAQLLKLTGLPRSTFYYQQAAQLVPDKYQLVKDQIKAVFHRHRGRYGYRRICATLRNLGQVINHKTVQRLMGELGLKSIVRPKKYRSYKGGVGQVAPNILKRRFLAKRPYQKWVTDVTEFAVAGKKLYLSPVMDLHNGEIISYQTATRPSFELVSTMLRKALAKIPRHATPVLHSDQGWQYQMAAYRKTLQTKQVRQSMSRKGNCLDNAAMESFFAVLKSEFFHPNKFTSVEQLRKGLAKYIHYYNHDRIKMKLGGLSPVEYRTRSSTA